MRLIEYPKWIHLTLIVYESFRRLKFQPEEIFFCVVNEGSSNPPEPAFCVTIGEVPNHVFVYGITKITDTGLTEKQILQTFNDASKIYNDRSRKGEYEEVHAAFMKWNDQSIHFSTELLLRLQDKGLFPRDPTKRYIKHA